MSGDVLNELEDFLNSPPKRQQRYKLTNMKLNEVSLCSRPANPGALQVLFKSHNPTSTVTSSNTFSFSNDELPESPIEKGGEDMSSLLRTEESLGTVMLAKSRSCQSKEEFFCELEEQLKKRDPLHAYGPLPNQVATFLQSPDGQEVYKAYLNLPHYEEEAEQPYQPLLTPTERSLFAKAAELAADPRTGIKSTPEAVDYLLKQDRTLIQKVRMEQARGEYEG